MDIQTERLKLRKIRVQDADDYFEIFGNPNIAKYDDFIPMRFEETEENINRIINNYDNDSDENEYSVEHKESGRVIGIIYLKKEKSLVFIGYHFNEAWHGRGYAFEAVKALVSYLDKETSREVRAKVDPANTPSIKLLDKLGFVFHDKTLIKDSAGNKKEELIYRFMKNL